MKIQVMSDLHLEFEPENRPKISPKADVLVYAGDISSSERDIQYYFEEVRKCTEAPIVYVLGNHEFYGKFLHQVSAYKDAVKGISNCHILDKDSFSFEGVRFIGCTLWTDFDDRRGELDAQIGMADYKHIRRVGQYYDIELITTEDILREYYKCRDYLDRAFQGFKGSEDKSCVVVTHHSPSFYCVPEKWKGYRLNAAFYVELSNLILRENPALWIYGHTHMNNRCKIGSTDLVCNPWGYAQETYTGYVEELLIEV
jgi:predicted phosphodiesterase